MYDPIAQMTAHAVDEHYPEYANATRSMLAALKTAANWLPSTPGQRGALFKVQQAIAAAESVGIKSEE